MNESNLSVPPEISTKSLQFRIARAMKLDNVQTAVKLSEFLEISYEAVRRELGVMKKAGLVLSETDKTKRGRPFRRWRFTVEGEHLFPKAYDSVLGGLLEELSKPSAEDTALKVLEQLSQNKSAEILATAENSSTAAALRSLYGEEDGYISVEVVDGNIVIIEKNCPILRIARNHPMICSVSTNAISRALGKRIVRSEKFQDGHGRCVFVASNTPYDDSFVLESDLVSVSSQP